MKNLFALNSLGKLIPIKDVQKELKATYHCCNCGSEMIAGKGEIKAHHFSQTDKFQINQVMVSLSSNSIWL